LDICDNVSLLPKDFYSKEHQMIFEVVTILKNAHKTIDAVTVADEL
jgi:replicative DNA helicase